VANVSNERATQSTIDAHPLCLTQVYACPETDEDKCVSKSLANSVQYDTVREAQEYDAERKENDKCQRVEYAVDLVISGVVFAAG
jgi:hypothetical protein